MSDLRDRRIRSAGVVQAVIASGAPIEEHRIRSAYGLALIDYFADKLAGKNDLPQPRVPTEFAPKERPTNG